MQKWVHLSCEHTWMRHGMQGHVAAQREPARVPAWHWGDVYIYYIFITFGYSTYKTFIEDFANRYIQLTL